MKSQLLIVSLVMATHFYGVASIEVDIHKTQGFVSRYSHTFELKNKEKKPITVQLYEVRPNEDRLLFNKAINSVVRFGVGYLRLDPEYHLLLKVTDSEQKQSSFVIRPDNKTLSVLVKYKAGRLEPQIGTYAGMSGYTTSGLPLINNIKPTQIEKIS